MRNLLLFLLYEYAKDVNIQETDRQAVLNFDREFSHTLLPEEIERHVLMGLHETPTAESMRKATYPLVLRWYEEGCTKEYFVRAGESMTYSPYAASHWPVGWQERCKKETIEGSEFDLEKLKQLAHLPFGSGQHKCPAKEFVVPVMSIILCVFLSKCRVGLVDPDMKCRPVMSDTLQPDSSIRVIVTPTDGVVE